MKLEVSVGEMIDKLTILKIKLERISDVDKLSFVKKELVIMLEMLIPLELEYPELTVYMAELYDVNCSLWDIENEIREKEKNEEFNEEFIDLARRVYQTNDIRAEIKNKINVYTNSNLREIKQYTEYQV